MNRRNFLAASVAPALALHAANVPRPAPDFLIPVGSRQIRTADYKGKVVVVEFLNTTCPACIKCAGVLSRLQTEYAPKGFQAVGVAVNPGAESTMGNFMSSSGANFPVGIRSDESAARGYLQIPIMERFLVPRLVIIDRNGAIRVELGQDQSFFYNEEKILRTEIEKLLNEKAGSTPAKRAVAKK